MTSKTLRKELVSLEAAATTAITTKTIFTM